MTTSNRCTEFPAPGLRNPFRYVTGHDSNGEPTFLLTDHGDHRAVMLDGEGAQSIMYSSNSNPVELTNNVDLEFARTNRPSLHIPYGCVVRLVDFAPGGESNMHRALSLGIGTVCEGEVELSLSEDGKEKPARVLFVMLDVEPVFVNGKALEFDMGELMKEYGDYKEGEGANKITGLGYEFTRQLSSDHSNTVVGIVRDKPATVTKISQDAELNRRSNIHVIQADLTNYNALKVRRISERIHFVPGGELTDPPPSMQLGRVDTMCCSHRFWAEAPVKEDLVFRVWADPQNLDRGFDEAFLRNYLGYLRDCADQNIQPSVFQLALLGWSGDTLLTPRCGETILGISSNL
ncbi:cupin [Fusarium tjaetaba]|uniref:Cupin n=1 Tax=Fusarium tjaetaba TaxID=1567544 RepID=A0A8H5VZM9_9HYPO|nr:cupin [Fusarium tjaetaba]KAF5643487.1 cupin [Fusarium tjaetaba]